MKEPDWVLFMTEEKGEKQSQLGAATEGRKDNERETVDEP